MSKVKVEAKGFDLPPEGLWVSPSGKMMPVQEHLLAIRDRPDLFDLSRNEVPQDLDQVRKIAENLISKGWTRYRYLDGKYHFEVDDVGKRIGLIDEILGKAQAIPQELVVITPMGGKTLEGTVKDVPDRVIMRFAAAKKMDKWAWSSLK